MWLLVILMIINGFVGSHSFLFEYRVSIAGMPVNLLDLLLFVCVAVALLTRNSEKRMATERFHPLFLPAMAFLTAALLIGLTLGAGNLSGGETVRELVTFTRDFSVLPFGIL